MSDERPKRKRIPVRKPEPVIEDELAFVKNKCSPNARKIGYTVESTNIDFWIDKHYHIRNQHGDNNGIRSGIEQEKVHTLVKESIRHLMFYSASVKSFTFLNHNYNPSSGRAIRVVCQKEIGEEKLNVVVEAHADEVNLFEITIITAMQNDEFRLSDGQYMIELLGQGNSVLFQSFRGRVTEIASI